MAQSTTSRVRPRRALVLALCALLAAGVASATAAPRADAATRAPRVTVVGGDRTISVAWTAVPGATGYRVRYSARKSMAHARQVTTAARSISLRATNRKRYAVTVQAVLPGAPASRRTSVTPAAGVPLPLTAVRAVPGPGRDEVTVRWSGGSRSSKVAVIAGSDVSAIQRSFHSAWHPAATRSITVRVPARYRAFIGAGTGNPVFVKVVQSNSRSTAYGPSYSYARKYRPTKPGTYAYAGTDVPAAAVSRLRVAELNIQSIGSTAGFSRDNQWAARAPRVAKYVDEAHADILTTAELTNGVLDDCRNTQAEPYRCASHTQYADFARRVTGLRLADDDAYARVLDQMRTYEREWSEWVTDGAHIFYNPATVRRLDWGYFSPALPPGTYFAGGRVRGLGVSGWTSRTSIGADRWITWAEFQTTDSAHRRFYVVAAHLPVGDGSLVTNARDEEVRKLLPEITRLAGNLPVVFSSDMNRDALRDPKPGHTLFMRDGWFDAAAVGRRSDRLNATVSTVNSVRTAGSDLGYGARPLRKPYPTYRIDYILLKNSPYSFRYQNVLRLHADGSFDKSVQGTDHNMQLATIGIASP